MSDDITKRPQRAAFKPTRLYVSPSGEPRADDWIINDIVVCNVLQIPRRWTWPWWRMGASRIWLRLTWWYPRKRGRVRLI